MQEESKVGLLVNKDSQRELMRVGLNPARW